MRVEEGSGDCKGRDVKSREKRRLQIRQERRKEKLLHWKQRFKKEMSRGKRSFVIDQSENTIKSNQK